MADQVARIINIDETANRMEVEVISRSACQSCSAGDGCGHKAIAEWSTKSHRIDMPIPKEAIQIDDEVLIRIDDSAVVLSSFKVYGILLLGLIIPALIGAQFSWQESHVILASLLGIGLSVAYLKWQEFVRGQDATDQLVPEFVKVLKKKY